MQITKEVLYALYVDQQLSTRNIGKQFGVSHTKILKLLKKYNISTRTSSRAGRINTKTYQPTKNLIGNKYGKLLVVGYETGGYLCKCDCGNIVQLRAGRFTRDGVKSCGCAWHPTGTQSANWKGCGELSSRYFSSLKSDALRRDLCFTITIEEAWCLFQQQKQLCAISKQPISLVDKTASLDRIDSCYGYSPDNVQWVHKRINEMKWDYTQEEFIRWCQLVSEAQN